VNWHVYKINSSTSDLVSSAQAETTYSYEFPDGGKYHVSAIAETNDGRTVIANTSIDIKPASVQIKDIEIRPINFRMRLKERNPKAIINRIIFPYVVYTDGSYEISSLTAAKSNNCDQFSWSISNTNVVDQIKIVDGVFYLSPKKVGSSSATVSLLGKSKTINIDVFEAFLDVPQARWFTDCIHALKGIKGYDEGTFGVNSSITRAEFIKILIEQTGKDCGSNYSKCSLDSPYNDVKNHWSYDYVRAAYNNGWIVYDSEHLKFLPDNHISRAEVATLLVRVKGFEKSFYTIENLFEDVQDTSAWYYDNVYISKHLGIFTGYHDPKDNKLYFDPLKNISRAESAVVIGRTLGICE